MSSIFSKIIAGEIPCHKVAEDEHHLAFMDINPNAVGHTLCIPKKETDKLFDLAEEEYIALMAFSRKVALAVEQAVPCKRIGLSVIGLEVPHAHVHLSPINSVHDLNFAKAKSSITHEELAVIAQKINANFN